MFSFFLGLFGGCNKELKNSNFKVIMYDIGKADCFLLKVDGKNIMIDSGLSNNKEEIMKSLEKNDINKIDYFILTHMDKDHIGSADNIIENIQIENLIMPNQVRDSKQYRKLKEAIKLKKLEPIILQNNSMTFETSKGKFTIESGEKESYEKSNDYSLITSIIYGNKKFLFTGDAETERLKEFVNKNKSTYDFIKMPHHGNLDEGIEKLLKQTKPKYAVITSDRKNEPNKELLNMLDEKKIETYLTIDGEIEVLCNGDEIVINQK